MSVIQFILLALAAVGISAQTAVVNHEHVGAGTCQDSTSATYSYIIDTTIATEVACGDFCDLVRNVRLEGCDAMYQGFDFATSSCKCYFDPLDTDSTMTAAVVTSKTGVETSYDIVSSTGTGEISSFSALGGTSCYKAIVFTPPNHEYVGEGNCKDSASVTYSYVNDGGSGWDSTPCGEFCDHINGLGSVEYRGFSFSTDASYCHCHFDPLDAATTSLLVNPGETDIWYNEYYDIVQSAGTGVIGSADSTPGSYCFKCELFITFFISYHYFPF